MCCLTGLMAWVPVEGLGLSYHNRGSLLFAVRPLCGDFSEIHKGVAHSVQTTKRY